MNLAIWPGMGALLIAVVWFHTGERIVSARTQAVNNAKQAAAAAVDSYALQLGHMIRQIDQQTLRLKYDWEDPSTTVDLERDRKRGLFPENGLLYANIVNAEGDRVTSSLVNPKPVKVNDLPYFQLHRANPKLGLLISPPSPSRFMGKSIVRFSRRLNQSDGSFDGVALISVEPHYLITFQEQAVQGHDDFISVRLTTGPLLASRVGGDPRQVPVFYRHDPVFAGMQGVIEEPGEKFRDQRHRYVAWKKLPDYPLVALAGYAVDNALAGFEAERRALRNAAAAQILLLFAITLALTYLAARAASRRRQAEETRETYRLATDAANEGFYMIRPVRNRLGVIEDFRLEDCNNRAAELLGVPRDRLLGVRVSQLEPANFRYRLMDWCQRGLELGFIEEEWRVPPDSLLNAQWVYRRLVRSSGGLALTLRDISAAKEQEQALANLANNDVLTKLPNRNWLNTFLPAAILQAGVHRQRLALLFIDLDNFKNINDTLGHDAGDELLAQAAERLRTTVRASDHVARLGGDEFVVLLDQISDAEDASRVAGAIVETIAQPFTLTSGVGNAVNASIGISMFPRDGQDAEQLIKHADIAMYAAKAAGKGRYTFYQPELSDSLLLRLSKERALREAIVNDEFIVHYQPRVGIDSGRLTSMEALVRWQRPQHDLVYPAEFIDVAEDMGLIVALGELVIEKVCRQLASWQAQGLVPVPVSINISPQQLKSGSLSSFVAAALRRHAIPPALIEAELTESAVIDRSMVVSSELAALRTLGIKLMIDDFGTGYSSMAQLHRLDVDVLKVDKAFTRALTEGSEGKLLFRAIMSMANALDICVVAEGVETIEQLHTLQHLACDEIQGHVVSEAVMAAEMTELILKRFLLAPPRGAGRLAPV